MLETLLSAVAETFPKKRLIDELAGRCNFRDQQNSIRIFFIIDKLYYEMLFYVFKIFFNGHFEDSAPRLELIKEIIIDIKKRNFILLGLNEIISIKSRLIKIQKQNKIIITSDSAIFKENASTGDILAGNCLKLREEIRDLLVEISHKFLAACKDKYLFLNKISKNQLDSNDLLIEIYFSKFSNTALHCPLIKQAIEGENPFLTKLLILVFFLMASAIPSLITKKLGISPIVELYSVFKAGAKDLKNILYASIIDLILSQTYERNIIVLKKYLCILGFFLQADDNFFINSPIFLINTTLNFLNAGDCDSHAKIAGELLNFMRNAEGNDKIFATELMNTNSLFLIYALCINDESAVDPGKLIALFHNNLYTSPYWTNFLEIVSPDKKPGMIYKHFQTVLQSDLQQLPFYKKNFWAENQPIKNRELEKATVALAKLKM